jgi:hypothetical protein
MMLENLSPKDSNQKYHSATLLTIICGVLAVGILYGVLFKALPAEYLTAFILPIIGWGSMVWKNKDGGQNGLGEK